MLLQRHSMEVTIGTFVFCACQFCSMAKGSEMSLDSDLFLQENKPVSSVTNHPSTVLSMVLHDAPKPGFDDSWLSWSITNQTGTVTMIFPVAISNLDVPGVSRCVALDPLETLEIVGIATGLLLRVESDDYLGWSGPLYGLDFRLSHPMRGGMDSWKKWSTSTNILDSTCLKGCILRLREISSNAYNRAGTVSVEGVKGRTGIR